MNKYSFLFHNNQNLDTVQVLINNKMFKQMILYYYSPIKNKYTIDTHNNVGEYLKHHAERKKSYTK